MRRIATSVLISLAGILVWAAVARAHHPELGAPVAIYDPDPSHLWNRLYAALLIRQDRNGNRFGEDSLDPVLWEESEYLLSNPSHAVAMRVLNEFLQNHGETLIHDPVRRVLLQRDLWALFDWSVRQFPGNKRPQYIREKQELQSRLAEVMRRLVLSPQEIEKLPDTYAEAVASGAFAKEYDPAHPERPFLPPDLLDPHGPWVGITPSPEDDRVVAKMHVWTFSGRSSFLVFVKLPGGHKATLDYFQTLWNFPQPYVPGPTFASGEISDQPMLNPDLPSFPAGTEVALIRRMNVFDKEGSLSTSAITESVQIRVYHSITSSEEHTVGGGNVNDMIRRTGQNFYEFRLSRPLLFSNKNGGLRAISHEEREFSIFQAMPGDPFEEPVRPGPRVSLKDERPVLETCAWCHSGGGVRSLNSRESLVRPNRMQMEPQNSDYGSIYWGDNSAIAWKQNRYDWGLLNGYWRASSPAQP
jgi:hypothetical protein